MPLATRGFGYAPPSARTIGESPNHLRMGSATATQACPPSDGVPSLHVGLVQPVVEVGPRSWGDRVDCEVPAGGHAAMRRSTAESAARHSWCLDLSVCGVGERVAP